ncbi:MAG: hypothetical protein ACR2GD_00275 [Pyrinomonadaceae bacterium]
MKLFGGKFEGTIGSGLERDGMFLEVTETKNSTQLFIEIFYSDATNKFSVTLFKENVDLELIEQAIKFAKQRLVPDS